jgi:hypothetical protein
MYFNKIVLFLEKYPEICGYHFPDWATALIVIICILIISAVLLLIPWKLGKLSYLIGSEDYQTPLNQ